jgi:hypothetical protein
MSVKCFAYRLLTLVKFKSILNAFLFRYRRNTNIAILKIALVLDMIFCVQFGHYFVYLQYIYYVFVNILL